MRVREGLRLSPNEERYILAEALTGQVYVNPSATRIRGPFDVPALLQAMQATCDRHEARRTGYERGPDGTFTKYIHDRATVHVERVSMPGASDEEIMAAARAYCMRPGDFSPGELHRYMLIEVGEHDHVWVMGVHHATTDGVSGMAFMWEVNARAQGLPVAETVAQYSDFWDRDWTASDAYREAEAFWLDRFKDVAEVVAWPADLAGEPASARLGEVLELSPEVVERTKRAAAEIGVSQFSFFYAVYVVLLSRLTGAKTVCTTFQSAGRRGIPGAEQTLGVFSNALMLATQVDESCSIAQLAGRMRQEVKASLRHEIFPFHHLIRKTGLHPRYAINWLPAVPDFQLKDGVTYSSLPLQQNQDDDDLNLRYVTHLDQVRLDLFYDSAQFSADRVAATLRQLVALADAFARDVHRPIAEAASTSLAPRGLLPDPSAPLAEGGDETIFARFLERARAAPDAVAVRHGRGHLTYADLESRSRRLAQRLREGGVGRGDRLAILADRGPELVWSILAAARLGAAFVVLDRGYPEPRLSSFLEIAAPRGIIWAGEESLGGLAKRLALEPRLSVFSAYDLAADGPAEGLDQARPQDLAYLLFTSGSTGRARCVGCSHQPLTHFVDWQAREFGLGASDRFTLLSGLSHDPLLRDIFTPLSIGAAIAIPDGAVTAEPAALAPWLARAGATVAHLTPQMGRILLAGASRMKDLAALRHIFWGGDLLRPDLVEQARGLAPSAAQSNFYGATETPQAAGAHRISPDDPRRAAVPVGRGIEGVQLIVVDERRHPVGIGEVGEIAVRSNLLPLGYVDKGRVQFPDDRGEGPDGRRNIHYTGDRGLYLPDGAVMVLGRLDDQIKVRGARVHLSEVSAALRQFPGVRDAIALPMGEGEGLAIAAFVTGRRPLEEPQLKSSMAARLPPYMTPQRIVWLESFPLLPNGKIDRRALLERLEAPPPQRPEPAANATEAALMEKWSQILGGVSVSRHSTFASLGGDSLSYVQAYMAAEEILGEAPTDWRLLTVAELAALKRARSSAWGAVDTPLVLRALAILMIVAGHFQYARYEGGTTSALMLVSGFMFGGLAMKEVFARQSAAPVLRVAMNIFIPTAILSGVIWLTRLQGQAPPAHILLFTADLVDHEKLGTGREIYLWFVHCLLHMMLIIWLAVLALKAAGRFDIGPKRFLYGLFAVACVMRFALPPLIDPQFYTPGHRHSLQLDFLPTSNLATLLLGCLVATATGPRERLWLAPVTAAFAALTALGFGLGQAVVILVACGVLLAVPRVPVPRIASPVILGLAGASLWIYLTHMLVRDGLKALGAPAPILFGVVLSLGGGVAFWLVWTKSADLIRRALRRPPVTADATV